MVRTGRNTRTDMIPGITDCSAASGPSLMEKVHLDDSND